GDRLAGFAGSGEVGGRERQHAGKSLRCLRRHHVEQRERIDRLPVERAVLDEALGQLAADHAGRAGDQDAHGVLLPLGWFLPSPLWGGSASEASRGGGPSHLLAATPTPNPSPQEPAPGRAQARPGWGGEQSACMEKFPTLAQAETSPLAIRYTSL